MGLRLFFALLAQKCVRRIALTKRFPVSQGLKTTCLFIAIYDWHQLISHIKLCWCALTPSSLNINCSTSVNYYLTWKFINNNIYIVSRNILVCLAKFERNFANIKVYSVTQFTSKRNLNFETEGVLNSNAPRANLNDGPFQLPQTYEYHHGIWNHCGFWVTGHPPFNFIIVCSGM